jgi:hypothetical protein
MSKNARARKQRGNKAKSPSGRRGEGVAWAESKQVERRRFNVIQNNGRTWAPGGGVRFEVAAQAVSMLDDARDALQEIETWLFDQNTFFFMENPKQLDTASARTNV